MAYVDDDLDAAEKAADEARKASFHRISTLRIADGATVYIRFITDRFPHFGMHSGIPTKPKPKEFKGDKWPAAMFGVCQNDKAFRLRSPGGEVLDEFEAGYGECLIHLKYRGVKDEKFGNDKSQARLQTFGLAVVRKPVLDPVTHKTVGFEDETEEFKDAEGITHRIPRVVIVQQTFSNFWAPIKATNFMGPATLCDKDFKITRKEKDYTIGASPATPGLAPGTPAWSRYAETLMLLGSDGKPFDLVEHLLELASEDWYARWFDETKTPKDGYSRKGDEDEESTEDGPGTPAADQPDPDEVSDFAAKMAASRSGKK